MDAIEESGGDPHSLIVVRHGHVVASGWWHPYSSDRLQRLYSLSKSFTATAAGLAEREGLLGFDEPVLRHFPELEAMVRDERTRSMRVRHLASMASGHVTDTWAEALLADPEDPVRAFLLMRPDCDPGSVFSYNQSATYTLARIIERRSGLTLTDYLRSRLLSPLGAPSISSDEFPKGYELGFGGMYATTETIALLGQLFLQEGRLNGTQYLRRAWVREAARSQIDTAEHAARDLRLGPDWTCGYGYQFWMSRHGYRGDGAFGQFCVVLPEASAVIAITCGAEIEGMQGVLDAVWDQLLPGFSARPLRSGAADRRLLDRLQRLETPVVAGKAHPMDADQWVGTTFAPDTKLCAPGQSTLQIRLNRNELGWSLTLTEGRDQLNVPLSTGAWTTTDATDAKGHDSFGPCASSGGWRDDETLDFEIIFLETPHRLSVRCDLRSYLFASRWLPDPGSAPHRPGGPMLIDMQASAGTTRPK